MLFLPTYTINIFTDQDHEIVASMANGLMRSKPVSNQELIKQSLVTISLFAFANKESSKNIGQELINLLFALIKKLRYDFDSTTLLHFKEEISDLTYEWILRNKLRKSLKR